MERTKLSYALFISLLLLLGLAVGFWVAGFWTRAPVSPPKKPVEHLTVKEVFGQPGWCCGVAGGKCVEFTQGALTCLKNGGKIFNQKKAICDDVCSALKK